MKKLDKLLSNLEPAHKLKLEWFLKNKGKEILRSEAEPQNNGLKGEPFLFSPTKGIYKPEGEHYALSFKQGMGSKYLDITPTLNKDGSWTYRYKEEAGKKQEAD